MLVKAGMEKYVIDDVKVVKVSNAQAVLAEGVERIVAQQQAESSINSQVDIKDASIEITSSNSTATHSATAEIKEKTELPSPVKAKLPDLMAQLQLALVLSKMTGLDKVVSDAYSFVSSYFNKDPAPIVVSKDLEEINNKLHNRLMNLVKIPRLIDEISKVDDKVAIKDFIDEFINLDQKSKILREAYYDIKTPSQQDLEALYKETKKLDKKFVEHAKHAVEAFPELIHNRLVDSNSSRRDGWGSNVDVVELTKPSIIASSLSDKLLDQVIDASTKLKVKGFKQNTGLLRMNQMMVAKNRSTLSRLS